jgi:hypothetical protein
MLDKAVKKIGRFFKWFWLLVAVAFIAIAIYSKNQTGHNNSADNQQANAGQVDQTSGSGSPSLPAAGQPPSSAKGKHGSSPSVSRPTGSGTGTDPRASLDPSGSGQQSGGGQASLPPSQKAAVSAAVNAMDQLARAQFYQPALMSQKVNELAVPKIRTTLEQLYLTLGPKMARWLGYNTVDDANARSNYGVGTQMYRVLGFDGKYAKVALYTVTHFDKAVHLSPTVTVYKSYNPRRIRIVYMELVGQSWLYAAAKDAPEGKIDGGQPSKQELSGLSDKKTAKEFAPYLKEYTPYVG